MGIEATLSTEPKTEHSKIVIFFRIASLTSASVGGVAIGTAKTSLDAVHDHYTKGIEVQQVSDQTSH